MKTFFKTIQQSIKNWYVPAIIGCLFILFGIYLFSVPLATYLTLVMFFSASFLFSGVLETFFAIQNHKQLESWGWYLTGGIFNILIGFLLIARPDISATILPFFIGVALLFRSIQGLGFSFELKNYGLKQWWHLAILAAVGILLSFLIILNPIATGISLALLLATTFIVTGLLGIILSIQLKKLKSIPNKISKHLRDKIEDLKEEYYEFIDKD